MPLAITANLDLAKATCQKPSKSTTERRGAVEQTTAKQHLPTSVEEGEVDDDTSQDAALKET